MRLHPQLLDRAEQRIAQLEAQRDALTERLAAAEEKLDAVREALDLPEGCCERCDCS